MGIWHLDISGLSEIGCPGVEMFTFIDPVEQGGASQLWRTERSS